MSGGILPRPSYARAAKGCKLGTGDTFVGVTVHDEDGVSDSDTMQSKRQKLKAAVRIVELKAAVT